MIGHGLNQGGTHVAHGLNPARDLGVGLVFTFDVLGDIVLELAPAIQVDALEDVRGDVALDLAPDVQVDALEDASGTFTTADGIKVE